MANNTPSLKLARTDNYEFGFGGSQQLEDSFPFAQAFRGTPCRPQIAIDRDGRIFTMYEMVDSVSGLQNLELVVLKPWLGQWDPTTQSTIRLGPGGYAQILADAGITRDVVVLTLYAGARRLELLTLD